MYDSRFFAVFVRFLAARNTERHGLGGKIRTSDPMLPRHVRCQLRYAQISATLSQWLRSSPNPTSLSAHRFVADKMLCRSLGLNQDRGRFVCIYPSESRRLYL